MATAGTLTVCLAWGLLLCGCGDEDFPKPARQYVVEGWIEEGHFPTVKLTYTLPFSEDYINFDSVENYVARWQRVTVSDGEYTVALTGSMRRDNLPPYVYTTTDMRGQAGKSYTLTLYPVGQQPVTAVCTIPERTVVKSFSCHRLETQDTLFQIFATLDIPPTPVTYYRIFTRMLGDEGDFLPSFLGVFRSDMVGSDGKVAVHCGRSNIEEDYSPYFHEGQQVEVRFCRIDSAAYEYWRSFEDMLSLSRIPLFPVTNNMAGNVSGALGFWQGWGSSYYMVRVAADE